MSSFSPSVFPSLLFSFNLEEIASDAYYQHSKAQIESKPQERPIETYKVSELFKDQGINLCELFGYHLNKATRGRSLKQRSQQKMLVWYGFNEYQNLLTDVWSDMGDFEILLQPLFRVFKQTLGGYVNLKHFDRMAYICKESVKSEMIAELKFRVSPQNIKKIRKRVFELAEKEDLKSSGLLEKNKILEIFAQIAGYTVTKSLDFLQLPKELIQGDYINYELFFSQEYLMSGKAVKEYLLGFCARRIVKLIKKSNKRKTQDKAYKTQYLKKVIKQDPKISGSRPQVKNQKLLRKQQKKQSVIASLLQKDKKEATELRKNKLLTAKQILMQIIYEAVEVAQNFFLKDERTKQIQKQQQIKKSIYTIDPIVSEDLFEGMWQKQVKLQFMKEGVGFFVYKNQGYSFQLDSSLLAGEKDKQTNLKRLNKINLSVSALISYSKIVDYQMFGRKLYLIREDGLFYVWDLVGGSGKRDCYEAMVQTGFKAAESEHLDKFHRQLNSVTGENKVENRKMVLTIDQQACVIVVNCASDPISPCLELYDTRLGYVGRVPLNKQLLSLSYEQYCEAGFFLARVSPILKSDQIIKTKQEYSKLLFKHGYPFGCDRAQMLGFYVIQQFAQKGLSSQVQHFETYFRFAISNRHSSKVPFAESHFNELNTFKNKKLPFNKLNAQMLTYLRDMNYIKNLKQDDLRLFLDETEIMMVKDRKYNILTLFEDNFSVFEDLLVAREFSNLITKNKFISLLKQCDFTQNQASMIVDTFPSTPDNLIDIAGFLSAEHTLRVKDFKEGKISTTKKYKTLVLPPIELSALHLVLKQEMVVMGLKQGPKSCQKLYVVNLKGQLMNCVSIKDVGLRVSRIFSSYVAATGHLMCLKNQTIQFFDVSQLGVASSEPVKPVKQIQGVQTSFASTQVLSLTFSYTQNSLILLTTQALYVYDFNELIQQKSQQTKFKIKPGYMAVTTDVAGARVSQGHQVKRKYATNQNERNLAVLVDPSKHGQNYVTVVSCNKKDAALHVKSLYLSKHELKITKEQIAKPLPQKLFKQLQARAKRNHYQDSRQQRLQLSENEHHLSLNLVDYLKSKFAEMANPEMSTSTSDSSSHDKEKSFKDTAIVRLNNIYSLLSNTKALVRSRALIDQSTQEKELRLSIAMGILLAEGEEELKESLSMEFISLYRAPSSSAINPINRKLMLNDFTTHEQKILIQRLLYYCSLIDRFLTPVVRDSSDQRQKAQLIRDTLSNYQQGVQVDVQKIIDLICVKHKIKVVGSSSMRGSVTKMQTKTVMIPAPNLVAVTFGSVLGLEAFRQDDPLQVISKIILNCIPTKYKYLSPRYYKQQMDMQETKASTKFSQKSQSEFFVNNIGSLSIEIPSYKEFLFENIISNPIVQNITKDGFVQFLKNRNGFYLYKNQIQKKYPQVKRNYRTLVEMLFAYKVVDQFEMVKLITRDEAVFVNCDQTPDMAESRQQITQGVDSIMESIYQTITIQQLPLPKPYITLQYFKTYLFPKPNAEQIFLTHFLKSFEPSSDTQPQIHTRNFSPILQLTAKKNITLQYHPEQWEQLVGDRVVPLISYAGQLEESLVAFQYMKYEEFKDFVETFAEADLKELALGCLAASLVFSKRRQGLLQELKTKPSAFYVNIGHFLKYLNDKKKQFISKLFNMVEASQAQKQQDMDFEKFQSSIAVPSHYLIESLWSSGNLLDQNELLCLVSHSLTEIKLQDVNRWVEKHVKWVAVGIVTEENLIASKNKSLLDSQLKRQFFVDPLEIGFVIKHLETNIELTIETIAWKLYQAHDTLDFAKSFTSKCVTIQGRVSFPQAVKFIGCESMTRWLTKVASQVNSINVAEFQKILKTLSNVICKKVWSYNVLVWGESINLTLSLLKSFADVSQASAKRKQPGQKKKTKLSSLAKYFIHPQLSLIQSQSQWVTVLKYVYVRCKHYLHTKESEQNKKEKNLLTLLKTVSNQAEKSVYKHELDVDEVEIEDFYACVAWTVAEGDFLSVNRLESVIGDVQSYAGFGVQKLVEMAQRQQLRLVAKRPQNILPPKAITPTPFAYTLTPQAIQKVLHLSQPYTYLPSKLSFHSFLTLHQQFSNPPSNKARNINDLTRYQKELLKKLYKSILQNSSHENNTLNEFYRQMRYESFEGEPTNEQRIQGIFNFEESARIDKYFAQFYSKVKNFSKTLSKLTFFDISVIYQLLKVDASQQQSHHNQPQLASKPLTKQSKQPKQKHHLLSYTKLFHFSSLIISPKIKQEWVASYLFTKKTIQLMQKKNRHQQQIDQYAVNLAVYEELLLCSMWQQPVDQKINQKQKTQIVSKLVEHFDFQKYVYNKRFEDDDQKSRVISAALIKIDELREFVARAGDLLGGEITQVEAIALFHFFDHHRKVLANPLAKQTGFHDARPAHQHKAQILAESLQFLAHTKNIPNINLLQAESSTSFPSHYPHLHAYLVGSHLLSDSLHSESSNFHSTFYQTSQKAITCISELALTLIKEQTQVRNMVKSLLKNFMNSTHLKAETFYKTVLNVDLVDEIENVVYTMNEKITEVVTFLVAGKIAEINKMALFEKVNATEQTLKSGLIKLVVQAFISFDSHGLQRPYGLTIEELKKQILHFSQSEQKNLKKQKEGHSQVVHSYEQIYKELDILGIGEVNLNDLKFSQALIYERLVKSRKSPNQQSQQVELKQAYVKISAYLRESHPEIRKELKYLKPNPKILENADEIIAQLVKAEEVSASFRAQQISSTGYSTNRAKLVSRENVFKILYPYTDEAQMHFILEAFDSNRLCNYGDFNFSKQMGQERSHGIALAEAYTQKTSNFISLESLVEYVTAQQSQNSQKSTNEITSHTKQCIVYLVEWIQNEGGILKIVRTKNQLLNNTFATVLIACPQNDVRNKYDHAGDLIMAIITELLKLILKSKQNEQRSLSLLKSLTKVAQQLRTCFQFYSRYQKQSFVKIGFIHLDQFALSTLVPAVTELMEHQYAKELNLNSTSNKQVQRLKELSLNKYKLLQKMYISCSKQVNIKFSAHSDEIKSKYAIFEELINSLNDDSISESTNNNKTKFDLVDFWMFINTHSDIAYSKTEIDQIFKIIDENDDKDISFNEFVIFWMAVEQLIPKSVVLSKISAKRHLTPMEAMKHELRTLFIQIFIKQIESSSQKNRITYSQILKLFNTSNKQKINKLIEIVFEDKENDFSQFNIVQISPNKGYDVPAFINNVLENVLDKDQLKIIRKSLDRESQQTSNGQILSIKNSEQDKNRQKSFAFPKNLILEWVSEDLCNFIIIKTKKSKKDSEQKILRTQDLIKYIILKYPHIGRAIIQNLYQRNDKTFYIDKLIILLKSLSHKASEWKTSVSQNLQAQQSFVSKILSTLKNGDSLAKMYHYMTKSKISHFFGRSISFRVLLSEIIGEIDFLSSQIDQISTWIMKECWNQQNLPLIFGVRQKSQYLPDIYQVRPLADCEAEMKAKFNQMVLDPLKQKFSQNMTKEVISQNQVLFSGKIRQSVFRIKSAAQVFDFMEETLSLKPDTRFKSNNLGTLSLNMPIYFDAQISLGLIANIQEVKKSKGQEVKLYFIRQENKVWRQILTLKRPNGPSLDCIDSLIELAQMNFKIHKKYRTIGVLIDMDNIFCNVLSQQSNKPGFRLRHFYQGVNLGADGNYAEGFDMVELYAHLPRSYKIVSLPPELDENVYTYAVDSFIFGNLLFLLYTGESFESAKQKEDQLKVKRQKLKTVQKNKIQSSFYLHHSYVHTESVKKIKELIKKMGKKTGVSYEALQSQLIVYTLIYKCTLYNWYQRPQMHQILATLNQVKSIIIGNQLQSTIALENFLRPYNQEEIIIELIDKKSIQELKNTLTACKGDKKAQVWTMGGLNRVKQEIGEMSQNQPEDKQFIIELYEFFNLKVKDYLNFIKSQHSKAPQGMQAGSQIDRGLSSKKGLPDIKPIGSPKNSFIKFGQTNKSLMFQTQLNQSQKHIRQQSEHSGKKTFLQTQSMLSAQKSQTQENTLPQLDSDQKNIFYAEIQALLKMLLSHIESASTKATLWISLYLFKDLLNDPGVKHYLEECDRKWTIESFDVLKKIDSVNLKDKITSLPKNLFFYQDFCQLMEDKITLNLMADSKETTDEKTLSDKGIQHDSSKLLALNHILSILLSNNLNKLNALYQSQIISRIYIYLSSKDEELKAKVMQIYSLVARSLKYGSFDHKTKRKIQGNAKKIDEVYKTMMVVFDELNASLNPSAKGQKQQPVSPVKKGSKLYRITESPGKQNKKTTKSAPVVDLLTYVQNFYMLAGIQSVQLIQIICRSQMCHLLGLILLCEEIYTERKDEKHMEILMNLASNREVYGMLKNEMVGILATGKLRALEKNGIYWREIRQCMELWESDAKLIEVSGELLSVKDNYTKGNFAKIFQAIVTCIDHNITYYKSLKSANASKSQATSSGSQIAEYNSFYQHFYVLIKFLQKVISRTDLENSLTINEADKIFTQAQRFQLLQAILTYLELTLEDWQAKETLIKTLLQALTSFYQTPNQDLYLNNPQEQACVSRLLKITQYLAINQPTLLINQGFIHIYNSILRKQFQRMSLYFDKKVEKTKIVPVYFYQTEWRLSILHSLLNNPLVHFELKREISKELSNLQLGRFILQDLYQNETLMDLRFYQCFEQGVPYRFSRPFKAEALVMIGILLKDNSASQNTFKTGIQGDIASKIVSLIKPLTQTLKIYFEKSLQPNENTQNQTEKKNIETLEVVEIIQLFSQISQSSDERLKYQFINTGTHEVIEGVFKRYKKIRNLFPKFYKLVQSNAMVTSSKIFQKSQLYESRRQFRKSGTLSFA